MFVSGGPWLALTGAVVLAGAAIWLLYAVHTRAASLWLAWPAGLLLGGGLANLLDRLDDGRVTDFIDVGLGATRWPTFNAADVCIVIAIAAFLLTGTKKSSTE